MNITMEQVLMCLGEAQVKIRFLEAQVEALRQEIQSMSEEKKDAEGSSAPR